MTYSAQYKGVANWFSPISSGPRWNQREQDEFSNLVVKNIGWAFHARVLFWILRKGFAAAGTPVFSMFNSPPSSDYTADTVEIRMSVYDDDDTARRDQSPLYTVSFCNTPRIVGYGMQKTLVGSFEEQLWLGIPVVVLSMFGVFTSVVLVFWNTTNGAARYFWLVEQLAVNCLKYYDWEDLSVNTSFEKADIVASQENQDHSGSQPSNPDGIAGNAPVPATDSGNRQSLSQTDVIELHEVVIDSGSRRGETGSGVPNINVESVDQWASNEEEPASGYDCSLSYHIFCRWILIIVVGIKKGHDTPFS
jgi:hypothetical protein